MTLAMVKDITFAQRFEELQLFLSNLVETLDVSVMLIDVNGFITLVNEAVTRRVGIPKQKLVSLHISEYIQLIRADLPVDFFEEIKQGKQLSREVTHESPSGRKHIYVNMVPVSDDQGKVIGAVAMATDLTDLKIRQ
ncbi:MAG: PAS domain-containing protein [Clostridia bacterium]|nr:PAS domain-containing protein [Clostridia bacterium]